VIAFAAIIVHNGEDARCFGEGEILHAVDPRVGAFASVQENEQGKWQEADLFNLPQDYPSIAGSWIENGEKNL
jgi:hypothetical protein